MEEKKFSFSDAGTISGGISLAVNYGRPMNISTATSVVGINQYSEPNLVDTIVREDSIELIYTENKLWSYSNCDIERRVFKIIFSCKDGKWNKSERIYGEIVPSNKEYYEF